MTKRLRIGIEPVLRERYGPEICWALRLLLTGIGLSWEEVPINSPHLDMAYLTKDTPVDSCSVCIRANIRYWEQRANYKLVRVGETEGWRYPVLEEEASPVQLYHIRDGKMIFDQDIIFYVFWLVTGQEELHCRKDRHGRIDLNGSLFSQERVLQMALASGIGFNLEKQLMKFGFTPTIKRWPEGKKAAACVGHDVDYPEAIRWLEPFRIIHRQGLKGFSAALSLLNGRRTHWNFASWVSMEKELKIKSAFYFVARQGSLYKYMTGAPDPFYNVKSERFKKLFRYLKEEGFEIGLHASYRAYENKEQFALEKNVLEEASEEEIKGNRHHYWHMNPNNPESTLLLHEQIGLKYDSSLIHERYVGWRRASSWPFFPFYQEKRRELKVLQISTAWMDNQSFGYQKDNPGDQDQILHELANTALKQEGCLLVDIHDYVYDDILFPGWTRTYFKLWEYINSNSDFWLATPGQIAIHWINRYRAIIKDCYGLTGG